MVVTCEKCHTRFLLDEDRIKGAKVKARCSRCEHVFWVEREGELPESGAADQEEMPSSSFTAGAQESSPGPQPLTEEREFLQALEESEAEPEPLQAAESLSLPKPSILFTTPTKRSPWPWIIFLSAGFCSGLLVGGAVMWFWGSAWLQHISSKGKAQVAAGKTAEAPKVEIVSPPPAPPGAAEDFKDLELTNQEERYRGLVNYKGGQLLLIQGKVKNSSPQPRGPIQLKAMLTDSHHKTAKERDFYAGTVIFDDELQSLDPEEINRWLETPGGRAQKQVVEPGETQSFMVVFFGVPQNLAGYGYKMQIVKGAVAASQSRRK